MADVAVGDGEEDMRHVEMEPRIVLRCDGGFHRWSIFREVYDDEAE